MFIHHVFAPLANASIQAHLDEHHIEKSLDILPHSPNPLSDHGHIFVHIEEGYSNLSIPELKVDTINISYVIRINFNNIISYIPEIIFLKKPIPHPNTFRTLPILI